MKPGLPKINWISVPVVALILANIIPVWGVLFLSWDAFYIVLLYWAENLAIGFYNVLKIAFAKCPDRAQHLGKVFSIPFFVIHYGGFMAVHGIFVLAMFKKEDTGFMSQTSWPCFLVFVQLLFNVIRQMYMVLTPAVKFGLFALFISHGVSFGYHYFYKREFASARIDSLMGQPYARIVVMHIAILAGGFFSFAMGSPVGLLLALIILKTFLDVTLHLRQHKVLKKAEQNEYS
jgi:hypothetical protein